MQRCSKPAWRAVVADPHLEQVAEDEDRVGRRVCAGSAPRRRTSRGVSSARCRSVMKSIARQPGAASISTNSAGSGGAATARACFRPARSRGSMHDVLDRHVVVAALAAGLHLLDRVDDLAAVDDLAEHRVAPALRRLGLEVEEAVVGGVDEELRGRRVRVGGARHRQRVVLVLQAVVGLVLDRRVGRLLLHAGLEAAALDHEALDDAVEDRAVVVALVDVVEEVGDRHRAPSRRRARCGCCPWWSAVRLVWLMSFLQGGLLDR